MRARLSCSVIVAAIVGACDAEPRVGPAPVLGSSDAAVCIPNEIVECACPLGSGRMRCKVSGEGFFPCFCGGDDVGPIPIIDPPDAATTIDAAAGEDAAIDAGVGVPPTVGIQHPSDGETRTVNNEIPFDGSAIDLEDGTLPGSALTWSSDRDGALGSGASIRAALTTLGRHEITLSAIDSDGNVGTAFITLELVP